MDSIFGAPIEAIALVLAGLFALLAGFVAFVLVRNTILARMAVRNVVRRPARTALVITGLMLATAIIGSAFTTGDSITFSIKRDVVDALGEVDELVVIDRDSEVWEDIGVPETFPESVFGEVESALTADSLIDGVMPSLSEVVPVVNIRSQQFDVSGQISGLDPQRVPPFGVLLDQQGLPMDLAGLGPNEVRSVDAFVQELSYDFEVWYLGHDGPRSRPRQGRPCCEYSNPPRVDDGADAL